MEGVEEKDLGGMDGRKRGAAGKGREGVEEKAMRDERRNDRRRETEGRRRSP